MDPINCYMLDPNGRRPEKIMTRPRLPQAAIHCPPIADGNALGWLVYPNTAGDWEVERRADQMHIAFAPDDDSPFRYPFVVEAYENGNREAQFMSPPDRPDEYDVARDSLDGLFHDIHNPAGAITLT